MLTLELDLGWFRRCIYVIAEKRAIRAVLFLLQSHGEPLQGICIETSLT